MLSPFAQTLKIREQNEVSRRLNHIAQQVTLPYIKWGIPNRGEVLYLKKYRGWERNPV
jgi:hypothetical protein